MKTVTEVIIMPDSNRITLTFEDGTYWTEVAGNMPKNLRGWIYDVEGVGQFAFTTSIKQVMLAPGKTPPYRIDCYPVALNIKQPHII